MRVISRTDKITRATIETAWRQRARDQRLIVRGRECRGLALIVNPTTMAWSYAYRPRGNDPRTGKRWPNRTMTIGNPETHSPDGARTEANRLKGDVKGGKDPAAERRAAAEAERRKRSTLLGGLADEYEQALPRRAKLRGGAGAVSTRHATEEAAQVHLALADLEATENPAADLTEADIGRLLAVDESSNPRARFGALARFLDWCQDAGHINTNPCALLARARRPKAPQARAQYLTPAGLTRLWRASKSPSRVAGARRRTWIGRISISPQPSGASPAT